jgi:hypothetical protein
MAAPPYSGYRTPICHPGSVGQCMQASTGHPGFWLGAFLVALSAWNLHCGARPGGVYRWMFPNGNTRNYGTFVAVNMFLLIAGVVLVLSPFVRR